MSDDTFKHGTVAHERLSQALGTLVDLTLPHADNIDEGYFFEANMVKDGIFIGRYKVTLERVAKP